MPIRLAPKLVLFLPAKLVSADAKEAEVTLPDGSKVKVAVDATRAAAGAEVALGIRPEHLLPRAGDASSPVSVVRGEVELVENLGESALIYIKLAKTDALTLCRVEGTSTAKDGETLELGIPATTAHLFDAEGKAFPRTVDAHEGASQRAAS